MGARPPGWLTWMLALLLAVHPVQPIDMPLAADKATLCYRHNACRQINIPTCNGDPCTQSGPNWAQHVRHTSRSLTSARDVLLCDIDGAEVREPVEVDSKQLWVVVV